MTSYIDEDLMSLDDDEDNFQRVLKNSIIEKYRLCMFSGINWWNYVIEFDDDGDYSLFIEEAQGQYKINRLIVFSSDKLDDIKIVRGSYELKDGEYYAEKHHIIKRYSD